MWWMSHGIREQVDVVRPVLEVIIWFEIDETLHELIEILIE